MNSIFSTYDAWLVGVALAALMLAAWRIGWQIGLRERHGGAERAASKFDDASVALLGLLLAFTFSTSITKHDQRRLMVVADSNAIGDFYTCAGMLKEPVRTQLQSVIRDYAELRLKVARQPFDRSAFEDALQQFPAMHEQMSRLVSQALSNGTPIAVSLTNTLNDVTSSNASRLDAVRDRLPPVIALLLFAAAIISTLLIGREQGVAGEADVVGTVCFIALVALAVFVTWDLNQPSRGLILTSQEPFERLLSSMAK
jgi:hypothetical protein